MSWVDPSTRITGTLITSSIWNQDVVANPIALKTPPSNMSTLNEGTVYTTTSTSFSDVDATDGKFSLDVTTKGGRLLVISMLCVQVNNNSGRVYFDATYDGTRIGSDDGMLAADGGALTNFATAMLPYTFIARTGALAADTYTVRLQWKVSSGHTATIYNGAGTSNRDVHPQFIVVELS